VKVGDDKYSDVLKPLSNLEGIQVKAKSIGYVYNLKDKTVGAEFTCEWSFS
jgi:hypothetical protein